MTLWRAAAAAAVFTATGAEAHAFGARYDLPLPLELYLAAAGAAVALSLLGAMLFLRDSRTRSFVLDIPFPAWAGRLASGLLGVAGVLLLGVMLAAAFWGPQHAIRNFTTVGVWVIWWVGFLLFSALVVGVWPQAGPFRRLAALAARAIGRPWGSGGKEMPASAGLVAPLGLLAIAWVELVSDWSESPKAVGILIVVYLVASIAGGLAFGQDWFRVADPLCRIFQALGRVAPIAVTSRSTLQVRLPGEGLLDRSTPPRGEVALVTALIAIVLFDGLSETPVWMSLLDFVSESKALRPVLLWLRDAGVDLMKVIRTAGLLATVIGFCGAYWFLVIRMRALAGGALATGRLASDFVGALLPIAVAYHLSHYVSYLLIAGQLILPAASDPFGLEWNVFGTRNRSIDVSVIGAEQVWWIAFTALILGHALSVLVAHRRALQLFGDARHAALSQIPMTIAMVGLTVLSLWILSQPITQ